MTSPGGEGGGSAELVTNGDMGVTDGDVTTKKNWFEYFGPTPELPTFAVCVCHPSHRLSDTPLDVWEEGYSVKK